MDLDDIETIFDTVKCPSCDRTIDDAAARAEEVTAGPRRFAFKGSFSDDCALCEGETIRANSDRTERGCNGRVL